MNHAETDRITAIVLTLNEAEHLPDCLTSLRLLTNDIIVYDSGSTDATLDIAVAANARVESRAFDGYANQRNAALRMPDLGSWIVFLDADERLSESGVHEVRAAIASADPHVAAMAFPRRNVFFGEALQGGGWWPDYQTRVLRLGHAHYDPRQQVHEIVTCEGPTVRLNVPILHLNYSTWQEFRLKQRAYSSTLVERRGPTWHPRRREYIGAPVREFVRRVVTLRGYRDGLIGLRLAATLAGEELWMRRQRRRSHGSAP